jgi:predicted TPR repeat methyltransferase
MDVRGHEGHDESGCAAILARCERAEISPAIAVMEMLIATESLDRVIAAARAHERSSAPICEVLRLLDEHAAGASKVASMLGSGVEVPSCDASPAECVASCKRLFDWSVAQCEEASVALYSLGSAALLDEATREIVAQLERYGLLDGARAALDIGCGIGRMEVALAPHLRAIHGVDVSPKMIEAASRRCAGLENVSLSLTSGLDLQGFGASAFNLVLAVDSFPYVVQAGAELVRSYFHEVARVLDRGGDFVILNFAYESSVAADRAAVRAHARECGLHVIVDGEAPFTLWNARAFVLWKP